MLFAFACCRPSLLFQWIGYERHVNVAYVNLRGDRPTRGGFKTRISGRAELFSKPPEIGNHGHWPMRYRAVYLAWAPNLRGEQLPAIIASEVFIPHGLYSEKPQRNLSAPERSIQRMQRRATLVS